MMTIGSIAVQSTMPYLLLLIVPPSPDQLDDIKNADNSHASNPEEAENTQTD